MSWPHKEDGTIDWDTVFDDPDIGLASLVDRAHSTQALGQCAHLIVHSLFIREEDVAYRHAFSRMIDELIQSNEETHDGPRMHDLVLKLIHEIKENRVKHAQTYLDAGGDKIDDTKRRTPYDPTEALKVLSKIKANSI